MSETKPESCPKCGARMIYVVPHGQFHRAVQHEVDGLDCMTGQIVALTADNARLSAECERLREAVRVRDEHNRVRTDIHGHPCGYCDGFRMHQPRCFLLTHPLEVPR